MADLAAVLHDGEDVTPIGSGDPEPGQPREAPGHGPVMAGRWRQAGFVSALGLPPDCPVIPLGVDGGRFFFLNAVGQVVSHTELKAEKIKGLFAGRMGYLYWMAPRWKSALTSSERKALEQVIEAKGPSSDDGKRAVTMLNNAFECDGWDANLVSDLLYDACAVRGVWRDLERIRGRGAWIAGDGAARAGAGQLVWHCGHVLTWRDPRERDTGLGAGPPGDYGDHVYPVGVRSPRPWPGPVGPEAGQAVLDLVSTWRLARPEDALFFLGWMGQALVGGALKWRAAMYVTGSRGTGKSTLAKVARYIMGSYAFYGTNISAAGIYQNLGKDAIGVIADEFEASANPAKTRAVMELMRDSCSGGVVVRGGADGVGMSFLARNAFAFFSILQPAMRPQDRSRLVTLRLGKFRPEDREPVIDQAELAIIGRKLMRRMLERWDDFADVLERYKEALREAGHDSRGADQYGTLLAAASVLSSDGVPHHDEIAELCARLAPARMAEFQGEMEEWQRCLNLMLSAPVEGWRGQKVHTVGQLLGQFVTPHAHGTCDEHRPIFTTAGGDAMAPKLALAEANRWLSAVGLKIEPRVADAPEVAWWLAVPGQDEQLRRLLRDSDYGGEAGVEGVWKGSLETADPYDTARRQGHFMKRRSRINGRQGWAVWMRLDAVVEAAGVAEMLDAPPEAEDHEAPF